MNRSGRKTRNMQKNKHSRPINNLHHHLSTCLRSYRSESSKKRPSFIRLDVPDVLTVPSWKRSPRSKRVFSLKFNWTVQPTRLSSLHIRLNLACWTVFLLSVQLIHPLDCRCWLDSSLTCNVILLHRFPRQRSNPHFTSIFFEALVSCLKDLRWIILSFQTVLRLGGSVRWFRLVKGRITFKALRVEEDPLNPSFQDMLKRRLTLIKQSRSSLSAV